MAFASSKKWRSGRIAGWGGGCDNIEMKDRWIGQGGGAAAQKRRGLAMAFCGLVLGGLLSGCRGTPPPVPLSELNGEQARGHAVFQARCAACHYDRRSGPLHGPSLAGVFKKPALPSGAPANDERVTNTVAHGRNMMPAVRVDGQDMDDLLAYLHTL